MFDRGKPFKEFFNRQLSARPKRGLSLLPPLKRGQDFWIVVENSLTLIAAGWDKAAAGSVFPLLPHPGPERKKSGSAPGQKRGGRSMRSVAG
jgi:hypothetical protein